MTKVLKGSSNLAKHIPDKINFDMTDPFMNWKKLIAPPPIFISSDFIRSWENTPVPTFSTKNPFPIPILVYVNQPVRPQGKFLTFELFRWRFRQFLAWLTKIAFNFTFNISSLAHQEVQIIHKLFLKDSCVHFYGGI